MISGRDWDVWIYDWERGTSSKITDTLSEDNSPVWSPKGLGIAFGSRGRALPSSQVYWRRADGTGDVQRLTDGQYSVWPKSWHPSGKFLALTENRGGTSRDIVILPMDGDDSSGWKAGKPAVLLGSPANEDMPEFSPDGRWIAYTADYNGRSEVYVQPFPGPGDRTQISSNSGMYPTWSRLGQLFYAERVPGPDAKFRLMVVTYTAEGGSFRPAKPLQWSDMVLTWQPGRYFDLHPDGARFAIADIPQSQARTKQDTLTFFFNFFDELRRLTTPGR
jgi:Tol biopolymer transport system component